MNSSSSIQILPNKILVNIFSYFKEEELAESISRVCFKWNVAASDTSLWKNVKFEGNSVSCQEMTRILRKAPLLESVSLKSIPESVSIIRQICRCNKKLKDLRIKNCSSDRIQLPESVLINTLISCTDLESISITGSDFSSPRFFNLLAMKPSIKSVSIGLNNNLNINDILLLAHNCRHLDSLSLSPCNSKNPLTDEGIKNVIELLKYNLTSLKLDVTHLGKLTFNTILKCTKLKELNLKNSISLTEDCFQEIFTCLKNLHSLKIHGATLLSNKDFLAAFSTINEVTKQLEILKINNCRLDDTSLAHVLRSCCLTIRILNVQSCKSITSEISSTVKDCKQLTYLNLAFTSVCTKAWIEVIESLSNLSTAVMDKAINITELLPQSSLNIIIMENEFSKNKTFVRI